MKLSAEVRFSIVPEWVIDHPDITDRALRLYAVLARFTNAEGVTTKSRKVIADRMRCSVSTMQRALGELERIGGVCAERHFDASRAAFHPTTYTVLTSPSGGGPTSDPSVTPDPGGRVTDEPTPRFTDEPIELRELEQEKKTWGKGQNGRPKDELFETIVTVCAWDLAHLTRDARGRANSAAKELREVGARPSLVLGFGELWKRHYPRATLTPQAITGNWPDYMAGKLFEGAR